MFDKDEVDLNRQWLKTMERDLVRKYKKAYGS